MATEIIRGNLSIEAIQPPDIDNKIKTRELRQKIFIGITAFSGMLSIILMAGVVITIFSFGSRFILNPSRFLEIITSDRWFPEDSFNEGEYGALAMIYGTFLVGSLALVLSIFWGVSSAVFLSEYMPMKVMRTVQPLLEYIAAIPSVIFGLIAHVYIADFVAEIFDKSSARGPLTAAITLSFMASPIITTISLDALQSTPKMQRNAAKAFGATKYEEFRTVALPHAKLTIFASIMLAFGRVIGETMVVLMILGNSPVITWDLFGSAYTLTSAIANEIGDARLGSAEFSVLFVLAFLLLCISFFVIWISNLIASGSPKLFKILNFLWLPFGIILMIISKTTQKFTSEITLSEKQIQKRITIRSIKNYLFLGILGSISLLNIGIVFYLLFNVISPGVAYVSSFSGFYTTFPTFTSLYNGEYGIYSAIVGSLLIVIMASAIAFPLATAAGVYLSEFTQGGRFTSYIQMAIINISSIPSIVVGLFVYAFFSIQLNWRQGILPAAIALGIMMIPIVTTNTIEALRNIPSEHKISALALGATSVEAVKNHRIPYAFPSIITGYVLAIARVIGETAPLLFIAASFRFSSTPYPSRLTQEAVRVLPYEIYYNLLYSTWDEAAIWALATAFSLLIFVALLSLVAHVSRILIRRKYQYQGMI